MGAMDGIIAVKRSNERRQRENALRDIFARNFQPNPDPTQPGRLNTQNALAEMYAKGFGPEAFQWEQAMAKAKQTNSDPMSVKEWRFFSNLPQEKQAKYLNMKRQGYTVRDIGGVPTMAPQIPGLDAVPLSTLERETGAAQQKAQATKAGQVTGQAKAEAQVGLGQAQIEAEKGVRLVDDILSHPGLEDAFGVKSYLPAVRGTERANFEAKLDQLRNTVFIQNRQKLKGGGAITDFEGTKAEEAEIRATNAQSAEEFVKAMQDYKYWVQRGLALLEKQASGDFSTDSGPKVGERVDGYIYIGGDPADPASWKQ